MSDCRIMNKYVDGEHYEECVTHKGASRLCEDGYTALREQLQAAAVALQRFGVHDLLCTVTCVGGGECTCGLAAALSKFRERT